MTILINGVEYPLATTLRVAYKVQGQHNHEPYSRVFERIGEMTVEEQIGIVYAAFTCANAQESATFPEPMFRNYMLDHFNLRELLDLMQGIIKGVMGEDTSEKVDTSTVEDAEEGNVV